MKQAETSRGQGTARPGIGEAREGVLPGVFAGLFGALLGLALLKFGNPVVLEREIGWPGEYLEWVIDPWPRVVGYWLLGGVALTGLFAARRPVGVPWFVASLPLAWLAWETVAGTKTMDAPLTRPTLVHFASCVVCFYLGLFALSRVRRLWPFWVALLVGFALVLASGIQQHFGGLEETRRVFLLYHPDGAGVPKGLLERMNDKRIFATLFYANTFAGVILMLLPIMIAVIGSWRWQFTAGARRFLVVVTGCVGLACFYFFGAVTLLVPLTLLVIGSWQTRFSAGARRFLMVVTGGAGLACLYWSGSKGGWLLMLLTGFVVALFLPVKRQLKLALVATVLVLGLTGFFVKYSGYFKKGATSVTARFDYWTAAARIIRERPLFGTGPGTFGRAYERIKKPESEMARMTHNDYLEQASDSGVPGLVFYTTLVAGTLVCAVRKRDRDWIRLAVWLGTLGWALQSLVEFGLYIPAVAWPAFTFMGWLLGTGSNPSTSGVPSATIRPSE